jgi:hypothetical protein
MSVHISQIEQSFFSGQFVAFLESFSSITSISMKNVVKGRNPVFSFQINLQVLICVRIELKQFDSKLEPPFLSHYLARKKSLQIYVLHNGSSFFGFGSGRYVS